MEIDADDKFESVRAKRQIIERHKKGVTDADNARTFSQRYKNCGWYKTDRISAGNLVRKTITDYQNGKITVCRKDRKNASIKHLSIALHTSSPSRCANLLQQAALNTTNAKSRSVEQRVRRLQQEIARRSKNKKSADNEVNVQMLSEHREFRPIPGQSNTHKPRRLFIDSTVQMLT